MLKYNLQLRSIFYVCCFIILEEEPVIITGCEHCPPGVQCNPITGACIKGQSRLSGLTLLLLLYLMDNYKICTEA